MIACGQKAPDGGVTPDGRSGSQGGGAAHRGTMPKTEEAPAKGSRARNEAMLHPAPGKGVRGRAGGPAHKGGGAAPIPMNGGRRGKAGPNVLVVNI